MKDSIMMNSLFLAMNKAHEKLKSRQGVIGRLIEISKFYELAVMQLDGCLKIVEEETDSLSLEVNYEEVLTDLYVIRDRLQRRLDDTELTIMNTDSCLAERFENELKLREALEMKEKELVALQGDLDQLERTKSEGHQAIRKTVRNLVSAIDDDKEGDISQLKNSVDMKFCSFKQMFEERKFSVESSQIDQLSSDIDKLKESLDLAFGKMQNAIFLSAVEPAEHEWRWSIEKDVMLIAAKGLTDDFHDIHEPAVWKLNYFSLLMDEIRSLRSEFEQLMREKEAVISPSQSLTDFRVKIPSGTKDRPPLDDKRGKNDEQTKAEQTDRVEEEGGNYVAKLISTHERIIQKKIEEQRAKEKLIRDRWYSAMRKDKQPDGLNKKIQDVIARLDSIINLNPPPSQISEESHKNIVKPRSLRRFSSESEIEIRNISSSASSMFCQVDDDIIGQVRELELEKEESIIQSLVLEEVRKIILRDWIKQCYEDFNMKIEQLCTTVRMLEQESETVLGKSLLMEDACRKYEKENEELSRKLKVLEQANKDFEGLCTIFEEICAVLLSSLTKECSEQMEKMSASKAMLEEMVGKFTEDRIATNIEFETSTAILIEKMKDAEKFKFSVSAELQEIFMNGKSQPKTYTMVFEGLLHESTEYVENSEAEILLREEIYVLVFEETIREIVDILTFKSSRFPERGNSNELSTVDCCLEENEETSAFLELIKDWKMSQITELMIREDIYQFVLIEAAKDACKMSRTSEDPEPDNSMINILENGQDSFIQRLDYMLRCLESDQESIPRVVPAVMEHNVGIHENGVHHPQPQGTDLLENIEELFVDDEIDFISVRDKFENALHQLYTSRKLITELRFDSEMDIDQATHDRHTVPHEEGEISLVNVHNLDVNKKLISDLNSRAGVYIDKGTTSGNSISDKEDSTCLLKEQDCGAKLSQSIEPSMFYAVSEALNEFQQTAYMKLDSNSLRLEAMKHHLASLSDHMGSLQKNETLYKNAFMRRCNDLHLAETEVDLLGDQVDSLLTLLEKIHWTLYRHSPALRQHLDVQDLLNLINKEINYGSINSSRAS